MKAKYFNEREKINVNEIKEVAKGIKEGKTMIFPTETVYGIGADATNEEACKKVYNIKERQQGKPLLILISDLKMLDNIIENINEVEKKLIDKFWPGPLTIIFNRREESNIPYVVTGNKANIGIGIRMTSSKIAKMLIQEAGIPIVAPSANISGKPTGIKIKDIIEELGDRVDYILDCGDLETQESSTIVKVEDNKIRILRYGAITNKELEKIAEIIE